MGIAAARVRLVCPSCGGLRTAELQRLDRAEIHGVVVERALVYVCATCGAIAATPQVTAGRIFAVRESARAGAAPTELRVPLEAEDLAYAVHAALELRPAGDVFGLLISLGLRHAAACKTPDDKWRLLDGLDKPVRARPVLSEETLQRIDGLQRAWGVDRSTVARWLVVAGAVAVGVI